MVEVQVNGGVELQTPGGWKGRVFGKDTVLLLLVVALVYLFWKTNEDHDKLLREMQVQTWMMSLPTTTRPRLVMPEGARERLYFYNMELEDKVKKEFGEK